jgi:hypothetical protein
VQSWTRRFSGAGAGDDPMAGSRCAPGACLGRCTDDLHRLLAEGTAPDQGSARAKEAWQAGTHLEHFYSPINCSLAEAACRPSPSDLIVSLIISPAGPFCVVGCFTIHQPEASSLISIATETPGKDEWLGSTFTAQGPDRWRCCREQQQGRLLRSKFEIHLAISHMKPPWPGRQLRCKQHAHSKTTSFLASM